MLALETGLESGAALNAYLSGFDSGSLAVNLDPANLLMNGFDPYAAARALDRRIAHAHAKDARAAAPAGPRRKCRWATATSTGCNSWPCWKRSSTAAGWPSSARAARTASRTWPAA